MVVFEGSIGRTDNGDVPPPTSVKLTLTQPVPPVTVDEVNVAAAHSVDDANGQLAVATVIRYASPVPPEFVSGVWPVDK